MNEDVVPQEEPMLVQRDELRQMTDKILQLAKRRKTDNFSERSLIFMDQRAQARALYAALAENERIINEITKQVLNKK